METTPEIVDEIINEEENDAEDEQGKETTIGETSIEESLNPKRKRTKQKFKVKRRKLKEIGAPKMPLTGYVRYMNFRKESIRSDFPGKQLKDYIKLIGDEWNNLPTDQKSTYLEEAEEDKARYNRELEEFFTSRPDILAEEIARNKMPRKNSLPPHAVPPVFLEKPKDKKIKLPEKPIKIPEKPKTETTSSSCTSKSQTPEVILPIAKFPHKGTINVFTDEFLDHNKCVDSELRSLRKSNTDYEMQNSILEKHVENMKLGVEKLHIDSAELQEKNKILENYIKSLKEKLALALVDQGATADNLEKILTDLQKPSPANTKSKEILRKLDLSVKI
ncbi:HMG20A family protein [Megaselia abdita]